MAAIIAHKAVECFFAEIAQLPDGTFYVCLTATTVDGEEPQLLHMEIERRRGVSLDEVLAVIKNRSDKFLLIRSRHDQYYRAPLLRGSLLIHVR